MINSQAQSVFVSKHLRMAIGAGFIFASLAMSAGYSFAGLTSAQRDERKKDNQRIAQEKKDLNQARKEFNQDVKAVQSGKKTAEQVGLSASATALQQAQKDLKDAQAIKKANMNALNQGHKNAQQALIKQDNQRIAQEKKDLNQARKEFNQDVKAVQSGKKTAEQVGLSASATALQQAQRDLKAAQDVKKQHLAEINQANKDQRGKTAEDNKKIAEARLNLNKALQEFRKDSRAVASGKKTAEQVDLLASAAALEQAMNRLKAAQGSKAQNIADFKKTGGLTAATLASLQNKSKQAADQVSNLVAKVAQAEAISPSLAAELKVALEEKKKELASANAELSEAVVQMEKGAVSFAEAIDSQAQVADVSEVGSTSQEKQTEVGRAASAF